MSHGSFMTWVMGTALMTSLISARTEWHVPSVLSIGQKAQLKRNYLKARATWCGCGKTYLWVKQNWPQSTMGLRLTRDCYFSWQMYAHLTVRHHVSFAMSWCRFNRV